MKLTSAQQRILETYSDKHCEHEEVNGRMVKSVYKLAGMGLVEMDSCGWGFKVTDKGREVIKEKI